MIEILIWNPDLFRIKSQWVWLSIFIIILGLGDNLTSLLIFWYKLVAFLLVLIFILILLSIIHFYILIALLKLRNQISSGPLIIAILLIYVLNKLSFLASYGTLILVILVLIMTSIFVSTSILKSIITNILFSSGSISI